MNARIYHNHNGTSLKPISRSLPVRRREPLRKSSSSMNVRTDISDPAGSNHRRYKRYSGNGNRIQVGRVEAVY
jgi:hypothetical protein